jgi:hypothetical protein
MCWSRAVYRILQLGLYYKIHRVTLSPNMESVEYRAIGHLFECHFNRETVVEPSAPIEFPMLPKHLMQFSEVTERPNKTFVGMYCISHLYNSYLTYTTHISPIQLWPIEIKYSNQLIVFCTDIVGIVVHCCEREHFGSYGKYREAIFMDVGYV